MTTTGTAWIPAAAKSSRSVLASSSCQSSPMTSSSTRRAGGHSPQAVDPNNTAPAGSPWMGASRCREAALHQPAPATAVTAKPRAARRSQVSAIEQASRRHVDGVAQVPRPKHDDGLGSLNQDSRRKIADQLDRVHRARLQLHRHDRAPIAEGTNRQRSRLGPPVIHPQAMYGLGREAHSWYQPSATGGGGGGGGCLAQLGFENHRRRHRGGGGDPQRQSGGGGATQVDGNDATGRDLRRQEGHFHVGSERLNLEGHCQR